MTPPHEVTIREFRAGTDGPLIRDCVVELQDFERRIDPRRPRGEAIAEAYVADLLKRCEECRGKILIAVAGGEAAGCVAVFTRVRSGAIDDGDLEYGLISDLVVCERYRGRGLGKRLIAEAEAVALSDGVSRLRICALAANRPARSLYESAGFSELSVDFEKELAAIGRGVAR